MAIVTSPLTALIWVFAVSAGVAGVVSAVTLALAVRHQRRLKDGVYAGILAENPSSEVLKVLTVSDYLMDPDLRGHIQLRPIKEAHSPEGSASQGDPGTSKG